MRRGRDKRRITGNKKIRLLVSTFIILLILALFFTYRFNIFLIKFVEVQIEKINCANVNQIKDFVNLNGQNFLFLDSSKTEDYIKKKFVCIKSVAIAKYFPNKVKLVASGREPVAILITSSSMLASSSAMFDSSTGSENFVIDNEGVIYSRSIDQINVPRIYISESVLNIGDQLKSIFIQNALKILEKAKIFGVEVKETKIDAENIFLVNGFPRMIFKLSSNVDIQLASLQLILQKAKIDDVKIEFIDLRFDKPVVKIAPKKDG